MKSKILGLLAVGLLLGSATSNAVQFSLASTGPGVWTYTLTYAPYDNYSIAQPNTPLPLAGLYGVTAATGPTSTDFVEPELSNTNLLWTPQISAGGTSVVWTHIGPGTGNFDVPKNVFGFQVFSDAPLTDFVSLATDGFARDIQSPTDIYDGRDLDIAVAVYGPASLALPVPEPGTLVLLGLGLAGLGLSRRRKTH
jgi:hypothetical protein